MLLADPRARRAAEGSLLDGMRRIEQVLGGRFPADAVVAQLSLSGSQLVCSVRTTHGRVLIRLALTVNGTRRSADELIAALADQALALAAPPLGAWAATPPRPTAASPTLPPDPLAPVPAGSAPACRAA